MDITTVRRLVHGQREIIWRSTAERLMAVSPAADKAALVDATGTIRRLRALVVMGHAQKTLAEEVGCAFTYISMLTHEQRSQVTVALEQAVKGAYARLSMTVGSSAYGRSRAASYGWHGPLAWDDDTIDDPAAVPQVDAEAPEPASGEGVAARWLMGESVVLDHAAKREVIRHFMEWTELTSAEIAGRLEMNEAAVKRTWERIKARARKAGGPVPYRRLVVTAAPQKIAA